MQPGGTFDPRNRLPWLVAAGAIVFALIVLVRSELGPESENRNAVMETPTPRIVAVTRTPRSTPMQNIATQPQSASITPAAQTQSPVTPTPQAPTYSVSGLVSNTDGKPIPNAAIRAVYSHGGSQVTANASSDASGIFSLSGLRSQEIEVLISEAPGHGRAVLEKLKLPLPDRLEIALSALAGLKINVLQVSDASPEAQPFRGEADFILLQHRNAAPTTASLGLAEPARTRPAFVPTAQQHVTIQDGTLRLEELEAGTYKAAVRTPDSYAESSPFQVASASAVETTVTLGIKHTLSGWVAAEGDLRPIQQAQVHVKSAALDSRPQSQSLTSEDGHFEVAGLSSGTYMMTVWASGYTTRTVESFEIASSGPPPETTYTLTQQQPAIRVNILDGDGKPMRDARLVLMMTQPVSKTIFSNTDAAGSKTFDNISAGSYSLAITAPGERARQKSMEIVLADGETTDVQISFPRTTFVRGHARKEGKPYRGLLAFTLRGSVGLQTLVKADETGGYAADLEPGEYMAGSPEQPNAQVVVVGINAPGNIDVEVK